MKKREIPPAPLEIRRYRPEDREAIWDVHNRALDAIGAHPGHGEMDEDLHRVESAYLDSGGEFLVGLAEGRIVAMGALKRESVECAEVTRMRVLPDAQGLGYGQAILTRLEATAERLGFDMLRLCTTTLQKPAQRLYAKNGYRETERTQYGPFTVIHYEKHLR